MATSTTDRAREIAAGLTPAQRAGLFQVPESGGSTRGVNAWLVRKGLIAQSGVIVTGMYDNGSNRTMAHYYMTPLGREVAECLSSSCRSCGSTELRRDTSGDVDCVACGVAQ